MFYLLINYYNQFLPYLDKIPNLTNYINNPMNYQYNNTEMKNYLIKHNIVRGIMFLSDTDLMGELDNIPKGINRLDYLNNKVNDIKSVCYLNYKKNKICELYPENLQYINIILEACKKEFGDKCIFWLGINNEKDIDYCINYGFSNPSIVNISPLNIKIPPMLSLTNKVKDKDKDKDIIKKEIQYSLNQYNKKFRFNKPCSCEMECTIEKNSLLYIKNLVTEKDKEIGGNFIICDKIGKIFVFCVENNTVITGKNEDIQSIDSLYSFHTHPYKAYIRNKVSKAWASSDDYMAFLDLIYDKNSIFHVVSTIEGIYILTLNSYWVNRVKEIKKIPVKRLEKMYNVSHKLNYTPEEYVNLINNFKIDNYEKNNYNLPGIFTIYFFHWEDILKKPFSFNVKFSEENGNCFISNKNIDNFRDLYKK